MCNPGYKIYFVPKCSLLTHGSDFDKFTKNDILQISYMIAPQYYIGGHMIAQGY